MLTFFSKFLMSSVSSFSSFLRSLSMVGRGTIMNLETGMRSILS